MGNASTRPVKRPTGVAPGSVPRVENIGGPVRCCPGNLSDDPNDLLPAYSYVTTPGGGGASQITAPPSRSDCVTLLSILILCAVCSSF